MRKRVLYNPAELAGMRLLCFAVKRNTDRVRRRYRNDATQHLCGLFEKACDDVLQCVEQQRAFDVFVVYQTAMFDYVTDDTAYGEDDPPPDYPF